MLGLFRKRSLTRAAELKRKKKLPTSLFRLFAGLSIFSFSWCFGNEQIPFHKNMAGLSYSAFWVWQSIMWLDHSLPRKLCNCAEELSTDVKDGLVWGGNFNVRIQVAHRQYTTSVSIQWDLLFLHFHLSLISPLPTSHIHAWQAKNEAKRFHIGLHYYCAGFGRVMYTFVHVSTGRLLIWNTAVFWPGLVWWVNPTRYFAVFWPALQNSLMTQPNPWKKLIFDQWAALPAACSPGEMNLKKTSKHQKANFLLNLVIASIFFFSVSFLGILPVSTLFCFVFISPSMGPASVQWSSNAFCLFPFNASAAAAAAAAAASAAAALQRHGKGGWCSWWWVTKIGWIF